MKRELIEAVMEYYSINRIEAIKLINLRQACGEYDELIQDLFIENYPAQEVNI